MKKMKRTPSHELSPCETQLLAVAGLRQTTALNYGDLK